MRSARALVSRTVTKTGTEPDTTSLSRREFLNYMLGASVALLGVEAVGAALWFALPHDRLGVDFYKPDPKTFPAVGSPPVPYIIGKFWISNTPQGLLALYMACPRREEQFYKWVPANNRFECPVCGSKFQANGRKIRGNGPVPRNLDRFPITVYTPYGIRRTSREGDPVNIQDATEIIVDTRKKILGRPEGSS
jgi:cytochrome b6-f complex iron-sulfur subunit